MRNSNSSSKVRARRIRRLGGLYSPFKPPGYWRSDACVYCGNIAQSVDHVPPLVWLEALGYSYFDLKGILVVKVPACKECNSLLGNNKLFTIKERTVYLIGRYEVRYKEFRRGIAWEDREIKKFSGHLKIAVSEFAEWQRGIDRRIAILEENAAVR